MRSTQKRRIIFILLLVIHFGTAWSQESPLPVFLLKSDTTLEYQFTTAQYQILPDQTGKLSIDEVRNEVNSKLFFAKDKSPAGIDTMVNTTWYRYSVKNNLEKEIGVSLVARSERSDFFIFTDGTNQTHYKSGFIVPWKEKDGLPAGNIIPIKLQAGEQVTIYNRVENDQIGSRYGFEVKLYNTERYSSNRLAEMQPYFRPGLVIVFLFCGFCVLAGIFNFLLFRVDRQKVHLHFSMLLFALALLNSPIYFLYITRYVPLLTRMFDLVTISLFLIFFIQFVRHYFQSFINVPRFNKFLKSLIFLQLILILEWFNLVPESVSVIIRYITFLIGCFASFVIFSGIKHPNVRPFTLALLPVGFAAIGNVFMYVFQKQGYKFSASSVTLASIANFLGIGWTVVYFTWILFKQYNTQKRQLIQLAFDAERIAKEKEIERNILIKQQKVELEKTVRERTAELRQSIEDLQSTQKQLIQSEKMASLGELTAGIAHEIQNPLNFVNNFSEVSNELVDEMYEELDKGDVVEAKAIALDIKQNLEKIAHHGKRADFIVKGMLQHSRTSTGEKQPTNINALADEFLKLSYHGLRAKDKSFNAELITNLDKNLPKVNVVQQDIGRVLLNLFNNAFYAVKQRAKTAEAGYKPKVEVITSFNEGFVNISVRDNGDGIPDGIKEKIMQPFFTTKPTGEGTGLGLSLSYDIVKAHGGEIKVETPSDRAGLPANGHGKEARPDDPVGRGEGAAFIIQLPMT